jgi:two-component sensor histidine kinase
MGPEYQPEVDLRLPPVPRAAGQARRTIARLGGLDPDILVRLRLLVSELVSNSVRHGRFGDEDTIHLSVRRRGELIRVDVTNPAEQFATRPQRPDPDSPTGWGLYLVERLAERWGIVADGQAHVWFELRC